MGLVDASCSCWASLTPFSPPTSHARRTSLPHKPNTSTPSHAMKHFPPQHHIQTPAVKHLSPQHPKNDPKSPIFTMQGRTFFHNTHHPHNTHPHPGDFSFTTPRANPHQPTVACNSTPAHPIRKSLGGIACEIGGAQKRCTPGQAAVPVGGGGAWTDNTQTPQPIGGRREACGV